MVDLLQTPAVAIMSEIPYIGVMLTKVPINE